MSIRVFLSATFTDLKEERAAVLDAFRKLRVINGLDVDLLTMEDFGFASVDSLVKSLDTLRKADAYLGILGYRYGSTPKGRQVSYTELEYRHAHKLRLPIFILERAGVGGPDAWERDPEKMRRLTKLKQHVQDHHLSRPFMDPTDLGKQLAEYLPSALIDNFPSLKETSSSAGRTLVPYFPLRSQPMLVTHKRESIHSVDVLAISSASFLGDRGLIETFLQRGCKIRILNVARNGLAARLLIDNGGKPDINKELERTVERARRLLRLAARAHAPGTLEMREVDWLPSATLFIVDASLPEAIGWVGTYTPDVFTPGSEKWMIELKPHAAGEALNFYREQFETLWHRATSCL